MRPGTSRGRLYRALFLGWAALTFLLTSIPRMSLAPDVPHVDKVAHFLFYGVMGLTCALWRRESGRSRKSAALAAWALMLLLGAVDEIHQIWIPGREADLFDWMMDAAGGGAGAWLSVFLPAAFPFLLTE